MVELILSGDSANKDVRKRYSESATLDRIGANLAEVLRHADALSVAALVAPLAAVARAGGADNAARLSKKMLGVFFEEKRTDSKVLNLLLWESICPYLFTCGSRSTRGFFL